MYVQTDENNRILAAYGAAAEGLSFCPDIVSANVLNKKGVPKYLFRDGRAYMRPVADILADEAALVKEDAFPQIMV